MVDAHASWTTGSELHQALENFAGDMVQAMQALKESKPAETGNIKSQLVNLQLLLQQVRLYCETSGSLDYPFHRSERQVADALHILYPNHDTNGTVSMNEGVAVSSIEISVSRAVETFTLGDYEVPRLFNGFWQLSSPAWGAASSQSQDAALVQLLQAGFTAADMADHYVRTTKVVNLENSG